MAEPIRLGVLDIAPTRRTWAWSKRSRVRAFKQLARFASETRERRRVLRQREMKPSARA